MQSRSLTRRRRTETLERRHRTPPVDLARSLHAEFRQALRARGLRDWRIAGSCVDLDLDLIVNHPRQFHEDAPAWKPLRKPDGDAMPWLLEPHHRRSHKTRLTVQGSGLLMLPCAGVAAARWVGFDVVTMGFMTIHLYAAAHLKAITRLSRKITDVRRERARNRWMVHDGRMGDRQRRARDLSWDDLVLAPTLRRRLETDVAGFFANGVGQMYRQLGTAYRRGVLLYGPPGNGKTSIIRVLGSMLPGVAGIVLRPKAGFDDDDLHDVLRAWRQYAPAMLIIEDLDTLFARDVISVSAFLNAIDGLTDQPEAGLMLIATTNHPERLDPAINNRPGRFDVVIEVHAPDATLRREHLTRALPDVEADLLHRLAEKAEGFSYAHLQELVQLSGLRAIHAGRTHRTETDLFGALQSLADLLTDAGTGFTRSTVHEFGFAHKSA